MFSWLASKQQLIATSYKWQEKRTLSRAPCFAVRGPQRCAGHAVISIEIHVNFNQNRQASPTGVCRQTI